MRPNPRADQNEELADVALRAGSFLRFEMLFEALPYFKRKKLLPAWFATVGDIWDVCDNIGPHSAALKKFLVETEEHWHHLMDDAEFEAWQSLPDMVTIYRGCGEENRLGVSWSLDRVVAEGFPFLNRYEQKEPRLLTAVVPKLRIIAVKLQRDEREIIALVEEADIVEDTVAVDPNPKIKIKINGP